MRVPVHTSNVPPRPILDVPHRVMTMVLEEKRRYYRYLNAHKVTEHTEHELFLGNTTGGGFPDMFVQGLIGGIVIAMGVGVHEGVDFEKPTTVQLEEIKSQYERCLYEHGRLLLQR
jgi:hypothetical protein